MISFTCYVHPEPQGSARAFVNPKNNRAIITSASSKLKPYRQEVTRTAIETVTAAMLPCPVAGKHVPVWLEVDFYLLKPESVTKKRKYPAAKPDADKLLRSTMDSLTGVFFKDDAQVVGVRVRKFYGSPERVTITAHFTEREALADPVRAAVASFGATNSL